MRNGLFPCEKKVSCGSKDAVAANCELGDVGAGAGVDVGASGAICAGSPVQDIKESAAGEQNSPSGVCAAGGDGQSIDGLQCTCIVIDLETADDAVTRRLGRLMFPLHTKTDGITLDARRNAEDDTGRKGAHQKSLAEFLELHAIPSSWFGVRRQVLLVPQQSWVGMGPCCIVKGEGRLCLVSERDSPKSAGIPPVIFGSTPRY